MRIFSSRKLYLRNERSQKRPVKPFEHVHVWEPTVEHRPPFLHGHESVRAVLVLTENNSISNRFSL